MKIIIVTGASGGHLFPALGLAEELKNNGEIIFICDQGKAREGISKKGYQAIVASSKKFRSWLNLFPFIFHLGQAFGQSLKIINDFKPQVVVGFGSYVSFPVVMAAKVKGIPTIIHEQNVMPGRANRILAQFVDRIAVSFAESERCFPKQKVFLTGCPIRSDILNVDKIGAGKRFNLSADKFTILVLGGSQGSHNLNVKFIQAISGIETKHNLQVIHLSGAVDYESVRAEYKRMGITHCVFAFLEEIGYAYKLADLVISRSGASTIAEITLFGIPAILVPYPFAYGHQLQNAKVLADYGGAIIIRDEDLSADLLRDKMLKLINDKQLLQEMSQKSRRLAMPYAAENLADVVRSIY